MLRIYTVATEVLGETPVPVPLCPPAHLQNAGDECLLGEYLFLQWRQREQICLFCGLFNDAINTSMWRRKTQSGRG